MTTKKQISLSEPKAFDYDDESKMTAGIRWSKWIRDFEIYLVACNIDEDNQKKAILLHVVGEMVRDIYYTLADEKDKFDEVKKKLQTHFNPLKNIDYMTFQFGALKREEQESIDEFVARLRETARMCEFGEAADREIKRQILRGCKSNKLKQRILEKDGMKLDDILAIARTSEVVKEQTKTMESVDAKATRGIAAVRSDRAQAKKDKFSQNKNYRKSTGRKCFACGRDFPHKGECPAKGRKCNKCGEVNHFAKCCKAQMKMNVNALKDTSGEYNTRNSDQTSGEDKRFLFANSSETKDDRPMATVSINSKTIDIMIDSGANDNVLDEETFTKMFDKADLQSTRSNLFAYGMKEPLKTLGKFNAEIQTNTGQKCMAKFTVVAGNGGCLLGFKTARQLGIFQTKAFCKTAVCAIGNDGYSYLFKKYPKVFNNQVGKLIDFQVNLHIDKTIRPRQQPYRRHPYKLLRPIGEELDKLLANDIIERVEKPSNWLSAMVPVPKAKKPGEVRITIDSRLPNKAIARLKYASPTTQEIGYDMNGSAVFSRVDLNKAFHQLELDEESREITTFITHKGLFRFKRLNMGVCSASEIFQHVIQNNVLVNLDGVRNLADDIIVFGREKEEHDRRLEALCKRLEEKGLTASPSNCKLGVNELDFFGLRVSKNGVSPGHDKIEALTKAEAPRNASEVRSILGLAVYCSTHIPNLATIAEPLWNLTRDGVTFEWRGEHDRALKLIKDALVKDALGYFKDDWLTEVTVDASPVGLAAVIAQINPKNSRDRRVVTYASRMLSQVEKRYSQVEKEALAVVWACESFYLYLHGNHFRLVTDNRAVKLIMGNPLSKPPARIERWALRMMNFDYEIVHKPGRDNIADYMSRHPVAQSDKNPIEDLSERHIAFVSNNAMPNAMTRCEIVTATHNDEALQALKARLIGQQTERQKDLCKPFEKVIGEVSVTSDGIVLRGNRIVIPEALVDKVLVIAHEGHLGMSKTKSLLRTKVWFPKMDDRVEKLVDKCLPCKLDRKVTTEPLKIMAMPSQVWQHLSMDFLGPLPNKSELMVVMDDASRMPIVEEIKSTAAEHVIPALDKIFSLLGIPKSLKSDNGPPFNGSKFGRYCNFMGIQHKKVTPEWPQANGRAECFMKNLNKVLRRALATDIDWRGELNTFLRCYRSTPHPMTGEAPSVLLFGRNSASRLPELVEGDESKAMKQALERDAQQKIKAKQYTDKKRKARESNLKIGDRVFAKQKKTNKWMTNFSSRIYEVTGVNGPMITVRSQDGSVYTRNISFFQKWTGQQQLNENEDDFVVASENPNQIVGEAHNGEGENVAAQEVVVQGNESRYPTRARREPERWGY